MPYRSQEQLKEEAE
jgi:hypothetical protein